jgi:hypothetical protein
MRKPAKSWKQKNTRTRPPRQTLVEAEDRADAFDAHRRELAQIEMAAHVAHLGGRPVLEALRAVRRGQSIIAVLEEFQYIPRWRGLRVVGVAA